MDHKEAPSFTKKSKTNVVDVDIFVPRYIPTLHVSLRRDTRQPLCGHRVFSCKRKCIEMNLNFAFAFAFAYTPRAIEQLKIRNDMKPTSSPIVTKAKNTQLLVFSFLLLAFWACPKPEPDPPRHTTINLAVSDRWTHSITLDISVEDVSEPCIVLLEQDHEPIDTLEIIIADTSIIIENLNPQTNYTYQAFFTQEGIYEDSSQSIQTATLDTTNHDMNWEIQTIGISGSMLRDVHIVNENDIWVVGQIVLDDPDSSWNGTGKKTFNAAHWDGNEWEYMRIINSEELYSIFYFNENDIWVSSGFPKHWNGEEWTMYHLQNMGIPASVEHCWGTSSDNMYFVGYGGSIVYYNGSEFTKMESETDIDFHDIWGIDDNHIWASGYKSSVPGGGIFMFFDGENWNTIHKYNYPEDMHAPIESMVRSVWTNNMNYLYLTGFSGQLIYDIRNDTFNHEDGASEWIQFRTRGTSESDVFSVGQGSEISHYNGSSYYVYPTVKGAGAGHIFWVGIDIKENLVVAVGPGFEGLMSVAFIAIGTRN